VASIWLSRWTPLRSLAAIPRPFLDIIVSYAVRKPVQNFPAAIISMRFTGILKTL